MVFYFTATGNSLYVAKQLEKNFLSIPQELKKENREYCDKKIGIVCPLFEFEIPDIIKKFIEESKFKTDYFYLIITYGCHDGGSAERTQKFLKEIDKEANYINTLKMADNALIVFDMAEQKRIDPEKKIDENLKKIKDDISINKNYIQPAKEEEVNRAEGYFQRIKNEGPAYSFPLYKVNDKCIHCGTCVKVCPTNCIEIKNGKINYNYTNCIHCMACIQACPTLAIQFATIKEPNPHERYRNPNVTLNEIFEANNQNQN